MTRARSTESLVGLVRELLKLPRETEWVELKRNNDNPDDIGEYLSALANSAALEEKAFAYVLWGIDDATRAIIGTPFTPAEKKVGNEELESWLLRLLSPKIDFRFFDVGLPEGHVVVLEVARAFPHPVKFKNEEYVRVGSYKKKLKDHQEKERRLWRILDKTPFEKGIAAEGVAEDEVLRLLDLPLYFDLQKLPLPDGRAAMLAASAEDDLIERCNSGGWNITNLGAILFAKDLSGFAHLRRRILRIVVYKGKGKTEAERERDIREGYAAGLDEAVKLVMAIGPSRERLHGAFQREEPDFPETAVRELIANALIHQDFGEAGAGPMVEIFEGRIEITNPGEPLVPTERFVNTPPKSRNDALASLMRRLELCEERGTGIDKVIRATEASRLPPPLFEVPPGFTHVVLFGPRRFADLSRQERLRACYQHACLKYAEGEAVTNPSLRERFGLEETKGASVSRLLKDAVEAGLLVPRDPNTSRRLMEYVPFWATSRAPGVGP